MARVELNTKAPDFTLEDFTEKEVSLSNYKGEKHVIIVFNRGFM
jgi:peroxiredoxin